MVDPVTGTAMAGATINTISKISEMMNTAEGAQRALRQGSLTDIVSVARVEPLTIVDSECIHLEYITDVLQSTQSIFAGYYMQAVSLVAEVGNINVIRTLDSLNPNRKADYAAFGRELAASAMENYREGQINPAWKLSQEAYKWRLPVNAQGVALEAESDQREERDRNIIDKKAVTTAAELANLSVGKLISVTLSSKGQSVEIPIAIRLIVNELPQSSLMSLLGVGTMDESFVERYYKWRAGRISFIRDLLLCQDLLKDRKKLLMKDKSGVAMEISTRSKNNKLAAFMTKTPSVAAASNIFVISKSTAEELNRRHGLDIDSVRAREKIFGEVNGMIIVVIDPSYERVKFYHRGVNLPTSVSVRDIRAANKNGGPNISDILQAYKMGDSITL